MISDGKIYYGKTGENLEEKLYLNPKMANRHGFICGATGTGKTITLKVLAESFSAMGVPVFLSDVKGDLSGMIKPGVDSQNMQERRQRFGLDADGFTYRAFPTTFYDIYGEKGIPLRTTVCEMGPQLMSRILELNDTQSSLMAVVFKIAEDNDLLLYDTKDLKAMLQFCYEHAGELEPLYGRIPKVSISTIIRAIVALEAEGGELFFGEPAINIADFFTTDMSGCGMINVLDSETLINKPKLYSAFMLYLLSELFEVLPEVGDLDKPKMVFFFDEAHLLFESASQSLLDKINQVIKLIRSKGVGIFFVTQSPGDIPDSVMAQLGNKIEHALRAYTPKEQKALKSAAEAFRENPAFKTIELLQQLGTGEAVVSMLDEKGVPEIARHAFILPPCSMMGMIDDMDRDHAIKSSILYTKYAKQIDSDSAYEFFEERRKQLEAEQQTLAQQEADAKAKAKAEAEAAKAAAAKNKQFKRSAKSVLSTTAGSVGRILGNSVGGAVGGKFGKTLGGNIGASLGRNILGTLFKS